MSDVENKHSLLNDDIKVYLDFISLIKSKLKIDKTNITSKEINIDQLKNIIIKTKPSNLNSLVINKIKNGKEGD